MCLGYTNETKTHKQKNKRDITHVLWRHKLPYNLPYNPVFPLFPPFFFFL